MSSFSGEDKHLGNNIPLRQSEQEQQELQLQQQEEKLSPFTKRILIVDDDPDITLTFKEGLEAENESSGGKIFFQVFTYNDPLLALAEFKLNFYDLLLIDDEDKDQLEEKQEEETGEINQETTNQERRYQSAAERNYQ